MKIKDEEEFKADNIIFIPVCLFDWRWCVETVNTWELQRQRCKRDAFEFILRVIVFRGMGGCKRTGVLVLPMETAFEHFVHLSTSLELTVFVCSVVSC